MYALVSTDESVNNVQPRRSWIKLVRPRLQWNTLATLVYSTVDSGLTITSLWSFSIDLYSIFLQYCVQLCSVTVWSVCVMNLVSWFANFLSTTFPPTIMVAYPGFHPGGPKSTPFHPVPFPTFPLFLTGVVWQSPPMDSLPGDYPEFFVKFSVRLCVFLEPFWWCMYQLCNCTFVNRDRSDTAQCTGVIQELS